MADRNLIGHKVLVKGVSTDIQQEEFENMLTQNKITFAEAARFISKRSHMHFPSVLVELNEAATAEALIAKKLVCQKSGMVFKVEEFRAPPSIRHCNHCQLRFQTLGTKLQKATCLMWRRSFP